MFMQEKKKQTRNTVLLFDLAYITMGVVIILLAVLAFLNPEENRILFPLIFFVSTVMYGMQSRNLYVKCKKEKKNKLGVFALLCVAVALFLVGMVSAWSLWF